ncbi:MAG: hypothetical protein AUH85_11500 [Chloroflexi bacterium 13_1_40CM_4_68_4]|nr:MAG: hypothetical protein AUH85_11500 [Chloroflexi bacterium 13_1_40CM_4_68_4]
MPDVDAVLTRARAAGVIAIVTCGEDVSSSERAIALATPRPMLAAAVGIHPHRSTSCDASALSRLRDLAKDRTVVAIGEIGLDFSGRSAPRDVQEHAFRAQLDLAAELDLPVVVHVRDAGTAARAIVASAAVVHGQVHCYSEGPDEVNEWVSLGFHLSFAGTLTFERSDRLRAAVRRVPEDRLLFETDAPYLAPAPHRGQRNEPGFVVATVETAARERGRDPSSLAERGAANARALFGERIAA